jgi:hypothetical protein
LPPTPVYQRYNYSPFSIYNITPEKAATISPAQIAQFNITNNPPAPGGGGCGGGCGCDDCAPGPQYMDGNMGSAKTSVAANPVEQIRAANQKVFDRTEFNLSTSVATDPNFVWPMVSNAVSAVPAQF